MMNQSIYISPKKVAAILVGVVVVITSLSITGQYLSGYFADNELATKVILKLNLDEERNNLPTWYQSSTLLLSSVLLLVIGFARRSAQDRDAKYWWLLSGIFLFLSLDESVSIHEQMTMPLRNAFDLEGIFFLSWVIPASVLMVIFAGVFAGFLFRLSNQTRWLMIAAGTIFLGGAVGVEMLGAKYMFMMNNPPDIGKDFTYALITSFEELLEMLGIVLFIYTLLSHIYAPQPETELAAEAGSVTGANAAGAAA